MVQERWGERGVGEGGWGRGEDFIVFKSDMRNAFNIVFRQPLSIALGIMVLWVPDIIVAPHYGNSFQSLECNKVIPLVPCYSHLSSHKLVSSIEVDDVSFKRTLSDLKKINKSKDTEACARLGGVTLARRIISQKFPHTCA